MSGEKRRSRIPSPSEPDPRLPSWRGTAVVRIGSTGVSSPAGLVDLARRRTGSSSGKPPALPKRVGQRSRRGDFHHRANPGLVLHLQWGEGWVDAGWVIGQREGKAGGGEGEGISPLVQTETSIDPFLMEKKPGLTGWEKESPFWAAGGMDREPAQGKEAAWDGQPVRSRSSRIPPREESPPVSRCGAV